MRARWSLWLADAWWSLLRRPAPWTWSERRAAVRAAEAWLRQPAADPSRPTERGHEV